MNGAVQTCPLCQGALKEVGTGFDGLLHIDFSSAAQEQRLHDCPGCALILNGRPDSVAVHAADFRERPYACSGQTRQRKQVAGRSIPLSRSQLQAELLAETLVAPPARVLDIGCFDGALLRALQEKYPTAQLCGQDVNPHLAEHFAGTKISYSTRDLAREDGPFDLICLSHALMYLPDVVTFTRGLRRLLGTYGKLFVQVADVGRNPSSLLLADQYTYFCRSGLEQLLARSGFTVTWLDADYFGRELVVLATPGDETSGETVAQGEFDAALGYLEQVAAQVVDFARGGPCGVLGTTANAAFVDSLIGDRVVQFVDESPAAPKRFRGKPVGGVADLVGGRLIIPLAADAERVRSRLEADYSFAACLAV